jgi:hypothetical protein
MSPRRISHPRSIPVTLVRNVYIEGRGIGERINVVQKTIIGGLEDGVSRYDVKMVVPGRSAKESERYNLMTGLSREDLMREAQRKLEAEERNASRVRVYVAPARAEAYSGD